MRRGGMGDVILLIAFHNAPLFKAGFLYSTYPPVEPGGGSEAIP